MRDYRDAKAMAQTLRDSLTLKAVTIGHSESLELVSKMLGLADWNTLSALLQSDRRPAVTAAHPQAASRDGRRRTEGGRYPTVPIRDFVPFPSAVFPLFVGRERTKAALNRAVKGEGRIVLAIQKDAGVDEPGPDDVWNIGILGHVMELETMADGSLKAMVEARQRIAIRRFVGDAESYQADIADAGEGPGVEATDLVQRVLKRFETYGADNDIRMPKGWPSVDLARDPGLIADGIAMHVSLLPRDRQELLTTLDPVARLQRIDALMNSWEIQSSPALEATRRRAMTSATQRNHRYATLEHLLLALLDDADASAVLNESDGDPAMLKADLLAFLGSERENILVEPGTEAKPSPAFRRVCLRAQQQAKQSGGSDVTGATVLACLLPETRSPAARMLVKHGVLPKQSDGGRAHSRSTKG